MGHEVRSWGNIVITTSTLGGCPRKPQMSSR
jgi:hypothetical protein